VLLFSRYVYDDSRPIAFMAVVLFHGVIAILLTRESRLIFPVRGMSEPLILTFLHERPPSYANAAGPSRLPTKPGTAIKRESAPDDAISTPNGASPPAPQPPPIDWAHEADLAVESTLAKAEREKSYRDLAGLSPTQLDWVRRNHMQPMTSHIQWNHPRYEFDQSTGLPILWINDHCVMVTVMVFCAIGHIEANGEMFKDMRDYLDERLTDPLP
jgi:hypothetical protein